MKHRLTTWRFGAVGTALLASTLGGGCKTQSHSASPYADSSEVLRQPLEAERLTKAGAKLLNSDDDAAESLFRRALVADLYHGPAHNNLGIVFLNRNALYDAASEFEWARKLMPGHPDPRMNLGLTLERAGRVDEAIEAYAAALEVYPGHMPSLQAITSCAIRHDRELANVVSNLEEISLSGESEVWRDWARKSLSSATSVNQLPESP